MSESAFRLPGRFPQEAGEGSTCLFLSDAGSALPVIECVGTVPLDGAALRTPGRLGAGVGLLDEHSSGRFTRPSLRGHRLGRGAGVPSAGRDWSTAFELRRATVSDTVLSIEAEDPAASLDLHSEIEALPGGAIRIRHRVTNTGRDPYVVDGLEVVVPAGDQLAEVLDFTGRHEGERTPQRRPVTDGLWLREQRRGKPGADSPYVLAVGTPGFGFAHGELLALHVAWSGNALVGVERSSWTGTTLRGGELLQPGEVVLEQGQTYQTPWVYVVATDRGLDGVAAAFHAWLRSLPSHPTRQAVTFNAWEAVYFDQDPVVLQELATLAARVGVERFVLDDGWFRHRRHDRAGLGDWWIDPSVWPDGLAPLSDHVHGLGMAMGLWFEPEMVNPDSDLYRAHPDWILSTGGRVPKLWRNQLVLDLSRPDVRAYLSERITSVLEAAHVDFVKWDHNRDLLEAGSGTRAGAPAIHEQTLGFYALLDKLRARHPRVTWESCAAGGGRIDLGVLARVQRVWTSDNTDALARQSIQRWSAQLVAPEYLGAHVSAPTSHQTGRASSLAFRAATAFPFAFGIEWDLRSASPEDLDALAEWIDLHKRFRPLLHSGRFFRCDLSDPAVVAHGVVANDLSEALAVVATLAEPAHERGLAVRFPDLSSTAHYLVHVLDPGSPPTPLGSASGAALRSEGVLLSRQRPQSALLLHVERE